MPNLQDVMDMADLLKVSRLGVVQDRCVAVRNRNASCRRCVHVCFADAVRVERNEVDIDAALCVNCGACVAVCPTGAIAALDPPEEKTARDALEAARRAHGVTCVACSRKAARHEGDVERFVEVPCLAHVTEELFVHLAARGAEDVVLVDGDCSTCKFGAASSAIDDTVENAMRLLESFGSQAMIARTGEFPPEVRASGRHRNVRGSDRRGLMLQTGSYLKNVATNVAHKAMDEKLGVKKEERTLRDRLSAGKSGKMPPFDAVANMRMLDDLTSIGQPVTDEMDTRRFGDVAIDAQKCSGCGLCVLFCPTKALMYAEFDEPEDDAMRYVEFRAADCTQCGLCADVCLRDCIRVSGKVDPAALLDFEPALLAIPKPQERTSFFNRL